MPEGGAAGAGAVGVDEQPPDTPRERRRSVLAQPLAFTIVSVRRYAANI
jgi:hypothetical protein